MEIYKYHNVTKYMGTNLANFWVWWLCWVIPIRLDFSQKTTLLPRLIRPICLLSCETSFVLVSKEVKPISVKLFRAPVCLFCKLVGEMLLKVVSQPWPEMVQQGFGLVIRSFCRPPGIFFIVGSILGDCEDAVKTFYLLITIYFIY